ncbi:MAG: 50S ribosome-binding GTPase [Planctomycetes bacterium]|nr:50S ribosome-binding GTPase [Planctomycetota bacterium]
MSHTSVAADPNQFAVLTDRGPAAIAVVRVRGPKVESLLRESLQFSAAATAMRPGRLLRAQLLDAGDPLDDILVSFHQAGPDWDIRLHLHGGRGIVQRCTEILAQRGFAESADPACSLWHAANRIETEVFAHLPTMTTLAGAQWLSEQAHELPVALQRLQDETDIEAARSGARALLDAPPIFDWYACPLRAALVGPPNAGKSSLVNALSDRPASVVSSVPGTTRDWLEIPGEIRGYPVIWLDTAGIRPAADALEAASIQRTHEVMAGADAILFVLDGTPEARPSQRQFAERYADDRPTCIAINKRDRMDPAERDLDRPHIARRWDVPITTVSATEPHGLDRLIDTLLGALGRGSRPPKGAALFTARQRQLLREAVDSGRDRFRSLISECVGTI